MLAAFTVPVMVCVVGSRTAHLGPRVFAHSQPLVASGASSSFLDVELPPLPSGARLRLLEGLNVIEEDPEQEDIADFLSVGGTVWPCAAALCRWLSQHADDMKGVSVLELGSGTGAVGLFAAALGPSRVLLTDGSHGLLKLQASNLERTRQLIPSETGVMIEPLLWGSQPLPHGPWHYVLGADLTYMYDPDAHTALVATLAELLSSRSPPRVLLAHEHRSRGPSTGMDEEWDANDETLRRFTMAAADGGLTLEQIAFEGRTPEAEALLAGGVASAGCHEVSIVEVGLVGPAAAQSQRSSRTEATLAMDGRGGVSRGGRPHMVLPPPTDDALPFTLALAAAAYFSGYATEGYEPHKL